MHRGSRRRPSGRFLVSSATIGSLAAAAALAAGTAGAAGPSAHAARTIGINESGSLHYSNKSGKVVKESGSTRGTLSGSIYIQLSLPSPKTVNASIQVYPHGGGLLRGSASANYVNHGSYASFSGRMNITSGSGRYSKAKGSGLSFSGTINRSNSAVSVRVSGRLSY